MTKILDITKFKAFSDDKSNIAKMTISHIHRVEHMVGKGENAGNQHFLLFRQCFLKPSYVGSLEVGDCGKELKHGIVIHVGVRLTLSQTTKFRLFQTERVCRRQFETVWKC